MQRAVDKIPGLYLLDLRLHSGAGGGPQHASFTDWIDFVQHRDKWRAAVNVPMKFRFPLNVRNLLTIKPQYFQ